MKVRLHWKAKHGKHLLGFVINLYYLLVGQIVKSVVVQVCGYSYQNVLRIMVADELLVPRTLLTIQRIN
jgi:hypothetical protein